MDVSKLKRVFIAINLPAEIKQELKTEEQRINELFPFELQDKVVKWVPPDNLHLTLLFLGYVTQPNLELTEKKMTEILKNSKPFEIELKKIAYGPAKTASPRLIWVKIGLNKELLKLAHNTKQGIKTFLEPKGEKEFVPHITLGRIKAWEWRKIDPEERPEIETSLSFNFVVSSVEIMESKLKRTGAEYKILKSISL